MWRPVIYVLAGVNGAGKSSVGGALLAMKGVGWYNPDTFARALVAKSGCDQTTANAAAWSEGIRRLEHAINSKANYAFETTLGGRSIAATLMRATHTHDVLMWFCGLTNVELHLARVAARVTVGGHDIPEEKIRERFITSRANLIALMPHMAKLRVFDNSAPAHADGTIPNPMLLLSTENGLIQHPNPRDLDSLRQTPEWAKPLLEAALKYDLQRRT